MPVNIKQVIQDLIITEFRTLQVEIRRLDEKIDGLDKRFYSRLDGIETQIHNMREEFIARITSLQRQLDTAIDLHERIAALEAKIGH